MDKSNHDRNNDRKWTGIVTTLVIIILMLGYLPLSSYLFRKHLTINYEITVGDQYDEQGEDATKADAIDVVYLDEDGSILVSGLHLRKRYTELILEIQGVEPESIDITAEYSGKPEQLWMHLRGLFAKSAYSTPLYLESLEDGDWNLLKDGDTVLYQKEERFSDISEFYAFAASTTQGIGLAGISAGDLLARSLVGNTISSREILKMPIRGSHNLALVVSDGTLHLEVSKKDLNRYIGDDDVTLTVSKGNEILYQNDLPDDGNIGDDSLMAVAEQTDTINLQGLDNGLYNLEIKPLYKADDFVITGIKTDAAKVAFKDNLFLFDPLETAPEPVVPAISSTTIYLDSPVGVLTAETWHPIISRIISMNRRRLLAFETKEPGAGVQTGSVILEEGIKELQVENPGSLVLKFIDGGFSFNADAVFDPSFPNLHQLNDFPAEDFDLVLTNTYQTPVLEGDLEVSSRTIAVAGYSFPGEKIKIILEKLGGEDIVLTSLRIRLEGK